MRRRLKAEALQQFEESEKEVFLRRILATVSIHLRRRRDRWRKGCLAQAQPTAHRRMGIQPFNGYQEVGTSCGRPHMKRSLMCLFYHMLDISWYNANVLFTSVDPNWKSNMCFTLPLFLEQVGRALITLPMERGVICQEDCLQPGIVRRCLYKTEWSGFPSLERGQQRPHHRGYSNCAVGWRTEEPSFTHSYGEIASITRILSWIQAALNMDGSLSTLRPPLLTDNL
ncbi:hypothetical protein CRENBAI_017675 [Crenichthys baileyi]|uniref:Uncharacterized protein n=1 Tax=Crenichthys baileyi TaxID=28760 RepID=A0AAV9RJ60_9TELE